MGEAQTFTRVPDWAHLRRRYGACWRNELPDGRVIAHIQNPAPVRPVPEPWMREAAEANYLDPARLFRLKAWRRTGWHWHTDLFNYSIPSYGPAVFTGFCGGRPVFGADTVWYEPVLTNLAAADRIRFDERNRYWRAHLEAIDYFAAQCRGVELLGLTDFGGPTDWIANLMGTENSLIAALEQPDAMRAFALRLAREYTRAYDLATARVAVATDGYVNWLPVWSGCPLGTVQDDMAINLSPALYREVFLPALRVMAAHTRRTVLHWHDGCDQHLPALLDLPEIDMVQYGHDPNSPPFPAKLPAMQAIQAAGMRLFISCVEERDAEFFIRRLDPRGLIMIINTADDDASRRMEADVARWTAERERAPQGPDVQDGDVRSSLGLI